jgi:NAD(P)-dependent dehydrogenase (short-subunit alcohol dehydrogenase family)
MSTHLGTNALVTGGGTGLGLACASHLLREGATVTIAGRTERRTAGGGGAAGRRAARRRGALGRVRREHGSGWLAQP